MKRGKRLVKMKWYVAYKFTGEDMEILEETMKKICSYLEDAGNENYCSLFDSSIVDIGNKKVFEKAFDKIDKSDAVLVFVKSNDRSEGMLMEIGYALAKGKRVVLVIKKDVGRTHLREIIDEVIEFEDIEIKLAKLKL
jgi:nucleoside 2-deoxyribosyltransferase